jgi:hypothetical protein
MPIALALLFCFALCAILARRCGHGERPPDFFLAMVARQLGSLEKVWAQYAEREETRRKYLSELRGFLVVSIVE